MDIQVGDKLTFRYKTGYYRKDIRTGFVSKIHSSGKFSVKREEGACLQFRADGTHANYEIVSIEKGEKERAITTTSHQDNLVNEHKKTRELIALSSYLLRWGQIEGEDSYSQFLEHDYYLQCENNPDLHIEIDHCDEGFEYKLSTDSHADLPRPLKNVSMLNSLLLYGEES